MSDPRLRSTARKGLVLLVDDAPSAPTWEQLIATKTSAAPPRTPSSPWGWAVGLTVLAMGMIGISLLTSSEQPPVTAPPPPVTTTPPENEHNADRAFLPITGRPDGDAGLFEVSLANGDLLQVWLPPSIGAQVAGFRPGGWIGPTGASHLHAYFASIADLFSGNPDQLYTDAQGGQVHYYAETGDLVFQFGSWVVVAPDLTAETTRQQLAESLSGHTTSDGFLRIELDDSYSFGQSHSSPEATFVDADGRQVAWLWLPHMGACDGRQSGTLRISEGPILTSLCDPTTGNRLILSAAEGDLTEAELSLIRFEIGRTISPDETNPFDARRDHVSVWTGEEVLIYGGCCLDTFPGGVHASTGLAWHQETNAWRVLPPSPLTVDFWWRAPVVWTGVEMVVSGVVDGYTPPSLQIYTPATDSWRVAANAPGEKRSIGAMVWTGLEILFVGGDNLAPSGRAWAYNPTTDTWRELPRPGIPEVEYIEGVWTGTEAIFSHSAGLHYESGTVAYSPAANTWRRLSDVAEGLAGLEWGYVAETLEWTDSKVLAYYGHDVPGVGGLRVYDPSTDTWASASPMPIVPRQTRAIAWTGDRLVIWGGQAYFGAMPDVDGDYVFGDGVMYDPVTDSWTVIARAPLSDRCASTGTWTGRQFVVFGGWTRCEMEAAADQEQAAAYHPGRNEWTILRPG